MPDVDAPATAAAQPSRGRQSDRVVAVLLLAAFIVGAALRAYKLDEGFPEITYPDETYMVGQSVAMLFNGSPRPLRYFKPAFVQYVMLGGNLAVLGVWRQLGYARTAREVPPWAYYFAGRVISFAFGLALLGAVFWLGRLLYDSRTGAVAALFAGVSGEMVRYAHFAKEDLAAAFFCAVGLVLAVRAWQAGRPRLLLWAAVLIGVAAGSKYNAGLIGPPLVAAASVAIHGRHWRAVGLGVAALIAMALAFLATNPYFVIEPVRAFGGMLRPHVAAALGPGGSPFAPAEAWQWLIGNSSAPIAGLICAGAALAVYERRALTAVLLLLCLLQAAVVADRQIRYAHYLFPVMPILFVVAANALLRMSERVPAQARGILLGLTLLGLTVHAASASLRDPRLVPELRDPLQVWALEHVPEGATIVRSLYAPKPHHGRFNVRTVISSSDAAVEAIRRRHQVHYLVRSRRIPDGIGRPRYSSDRFVVLGIDPAPPARSDHPPVRHASDPCFSFEPEDSLRSCWSVTRSGGRGAHGRAERVVAPDGGHALLLGIASRGRGVARITAEMATLTGWLGPQPPELALRVRLLGPPRGDIAVSLLLRLETLGGTLVRTVETPLYDDVRSGSASPLSTGRWQDASIPLDDLGRPYWEHLLLTLALKAEARERGAAVSVLVDDVSFQPPSSSAGSVRRSRDPRGR